MTSEEEFEVVNQPSDTCPDIDTLVGAINNTNKLLLSYEKQDREDLLDTCSRIEMEIWDCLDLLEKVRENCSDIRRWGNEWKDMAIMLSDKGGNGMQEEVDNCFGRMALILNGYDFNQYDQLAIVGMLTAAVHNNIEFNESIENDSKEEL